MANRKVKRVLVMLEYQEGDPNNGEVFDLTALAGEMANKANYYSCDIGVQVKTDSTYKPEAPFETFVSFSGHALGGEYVCGATHLDDVVNSAMPDGDRVEGIKKRAARLEKKAQSLKHDAMVAKLEQVASIRHQHPIARVTQTAPALTAQ